MHRFHHFSKSYPQSEAGYPQFYVGYPQAVENWGITVGNYVENAVHCIDRPAIIAKIKICFDCLVYLAPHLMS